VDALAAQPEAEAPAEEQIEALAAEEQQPDPARFYDEAGEQGEPATEGEEEAPAEEEAPEPIEAPISWAKDAKEQFAKLPREAQEIIATREKDRETFLQAKSREAATTRQAVETEARSALQTIMQNHAQQLEPLLHQIQPQQPDERLLASGDPEHMRLYMQQEAAYRHAVAQRETIAQRMQEAQRNADLIAQQQAATELQAEHELLAEKLGTEWTDPSTRAKLLSELQPIAAELGYSPELIAQARGADILAMKHVSILKAKADKWDAANKAKMVPVRAAKGAIPPTARPGTPVSQQAPKDVVSQLYPNDVRRN
jgi:hypothetical protein